MRRLGIGAVLAAGMASVVSAADGELDTSFGVDGVFWFDWPAEFVHAEATSVAVLRDRSVVVGGWVDRGNDNRDFALVKFRRDGERDYDFGDDASLVVPFDLDPGADDRVLGVFATADGGILVVGSAGMDERPYAVPALLRLSADGTPDGSFGAGGKRVLDSHPLPSHAYFLFETARQAPDGRILLGGLCSGCSDGGLSDALVVRLTAGLAFDAGFGNGGFASFGRRVDDVAQLERVTRLAVDGQGRIMAGGTSAIYSDPNDGISPLLLRFLPNGQLDTGFSDDGYEVLNLIGRWGVTGLDVDPVDDEAVVALGTLPPQDVVPAVVIARFGEDGAWQSDFGGSGDVANLSLEEGTGIDALRVRDDGRIMAAGWIDPNGAGSKDVFLARLLANGARDNGFDGNGVQRIPFDLTDNAHDGATAMALDRGQAIIAGTISHVVPVRYSWGVLRLQSDFLFASSFEAL